MKHTYIVCRREDRQATLDRLGELGILHVVDVKPPQSDELESVKAEETRIVDALNAIAEFPAERGGAEDHLAVAEDSDPGQLTRRILELEDRLEKAEEEEAHWFGIRERMTPWGGFARELWEELQQAGLNLRLVEQPVKTPLPELPEGTMVQEVNRDKRHRYLLLATPVGVELPEEPPPLHLPAESDLVVIDQRIEQAASERQRLREKLREKAWGQAALTDYLEHVRSEIDFASAQAGMGESEAVCYLQGYVPATTVETLQEEARRRGWAVLLQDPDQDDLRVPTKIRLARWAEPIRLVFHAMGIMPGYREIDISAWFMVFLSIFFALLFGDAGYGALFLVMTLGARKLFPKAPSQPFWLFGVFAVSTIIWGVVSGTYFGIQENLWWPLEALRVEAATEDANVQKLCFLLGAIHLSIAHLWNAVIHGRSLKTLGELSWISVLWGNYYLAQVLVLNIESPPLMMPLYGIGLVGIIFFSNPDWNPLRMIGAGVGALLMGLVNSFVDIVSYIRLFAVGAATVAVAESFNQMALEFLPSWGTFLIGVLILLFGHGLNVVLGLMSVLVHGVRLNVLEFSQHLGLQWSGNMYRPLCRRRAAGENVE